MHGAVCMNRHGAVPLTGLAQPVTFFADCHLNRWPLAVAQHLAAIEPLWRHLCVE